MDTFHQLFVLGRVAINTAQMTSVQIVPSLGACLTSQKNSHAALWKWSHRKRGTFKWPLPRVLLTIAIPGLCSESDSKYLGNFIFSGHHNVFYIYTLHITIFAEHHLEERGF